MLTGSNHWMLAPFRGDRLGKQRLVAHRASARGGNITCVGNDARVALTGEGHLFLQGTIFLPT